MLNSLQKSALAVLAAKGENTTELAKFFRCSAKEVDEALLIENLGDNLLANMRLSQREDTVGIKNMYGKLNDEESN